MKKWFMEIYDEFRKVVLNRPGLPDLLVPPVVFILINRFACFYPAAGISLVLSLFFILYRRVKKETLRRALYGLLVSAFAIILAFIMKKEESFFIPSMATGAITVFLAVISIISGRPLVAWSSFITRHWPLEWYRHSSVRPAYTETTVLWIFYFSARLAVQIILFGRGDTDSLIFLNFLLGWPGIIVLLAVTYAYGIMRLRRLGGPSVEEFRDNTPPPWEGQRKGF